MTNISKFKSATTNIQDACEKTIVFYKLNNNEKSISLFSERLLKTKSNLVILNAFDGYKNSDCRVIIVNEIEFKDRQKEYADQLFPNWKKTKVIGVTGTNGKSTVVHLCQEILRSQGIKAFSIGTIGVMDGNRQLLPDPGATTPSSIDLKRIFHTLAEYEFACIEVSSHALVQGRVDDMVFEVSGFTNLSQDHLDFHNDMDAYLEAKILISNLSKKLIVAPDEIELEGLLKSKNVEYIVSKKIDISDYNDSFKMRYNQRNLSLAKSLVDMATQFNSIIPRNITLPKGRFNLFTLFRSHFVVDYAHTPDAILNLVEETRKSFPLYKIITVFGCGGDRDRSKRPKMLEAALTYSDEVIVTTDNPRFEEVDKIINDIVADTYSEKVKIISAREDAISSVVKKYTEDTIVLIAGKGHEEYQDVKGVKHHFSDIEKVVVNIERVRNENK